MTENVEARATAGLDPHYKNTKNQFPGELKELRQIRDHQLKALGEENPDLPGLFLSDPFLPLFQNNFPNRAWIKIVPAESDLPCQTLLFRGLRSF